jgi:L-iditol 2-dehydrogenase
MAFSIRRKKTIEIIPPPMKVARLYGPTDIRVTEETCPVPADGESLVRITAVGICGSDLHRYISGKNNSDPLPHPLVLGHEFAGIAVSGPHRDKLVAVDPAVSCGTCEWCKRGDVNLCPNLHFAGTNADDGALREYIAYPDKCLHPLPPGISAGGGAVLETLGVALHSLDLAHIKPGTSLAILGAGPVGLLVLQAARVYGAKPIFITETHVHRRIVAQRFKAEKVFSAQGPTEVQAILKATNGRGVDVVIEASGDNGAMDVALQILRRGGRIVQVGINSDDRTTFQASLARQKGATVVVQRRMRDLYGEAIKLVKEKKVDVETIVSHRFPLAKVKEAFTMAVKREGLKVVVEPWG